MRSPIKAILISICCLTLLNPMMAQNPVLTQESVEASSSLEEDEARRNFVVISCFVASLALLLWMRKRGREQGQDPE